MKVIGLDKGQRIDNKGISYIRPLDKAFAVDGEEGYQQIRIVFHSRLELKKAIHDLNRLYDLVKFEDEQSSQTEVEG